MQNWKLWGKMRQNTVAQLDMETHQPYRHHKMYIAPQKPGHDLSGRFATLNLPIPMTTKEWEQLKTALQECLYQFENDSVYAGDEAFFKCPTCGMDVSPSTIIDEKCGVCRAD